MERKWQIHFDGACEPFNPGGIATYGFTVRNDGGTQLGFDGQGVAVVGAEATNNVAEYMAALKGLSEVDRMAQKGDRIELLGDSQLVIRQLTGEYAVNAPNLKPLHARAAMAIYDFRTKGIPVDLTWIPREKNTLADRLSKAAIKEAGEKDPEIAKKVILGFGKFSGSSLWDVPKDYYEWLWKQRGGELQIPYRPV